VTAPSITVAIATRARPAALERCLAAVAAQTTVPREVIVVDQAPSQAARAAATEQALPGVRYVEQAPLGLSASRNLALAEARTELLAVTDDDCAPEPRWLAALVEAFGGSPARAAVTGPVLPPGERPPRGMFPVSLRESAVSADHSGRVLPWAVGTGGNFAGRVDVLRRCGGWDERLGAGSPGRAGEDADLIYRLLRAGYTIRYEACAVVRHDWQTAARRRATRSTYGFGIGAMSALWLRRGEAYALRMLASFLWMHVRGLLGGVRHGDPLRVGEHVRAIAALPPGLAYGARAASADRRLERG
jgi:GT2 family glycosyltransferase